MGSEMCIRDSSPTPTAAPASDENAERVAALQESLYRASLEYLADTTAEANAVAKSIKFNRGAYENAVSYTHLTLPTIYSV